MLGFVMCRIRCEFDDMIEQSRKANQSRRRNRIHRAKFAVRDRGADVGQHVRIIQSALIEVLFHQRII